VIEGADFESGVVACGQAVGLASDIPSAGELVERIVREAREALDALLRSVAELPFHGEVSPR
ncbi:MAG TPA: hypothetical protein VNL92_08045, partial [Dehalococcoidia bacterium]|nr:hypothetical protein [Dehalococcoidia bacterium]